MNNNPHKTHLIIMILMLSLILTGAGVFSLTLNHTDSKNPLVDLGVIIHAGGSGLPNNFISSEQSDNVTDDNSSAALTTSDASSQNTISGSNKYTDPEEAEIVIRGTKITYNGYEKTPKSIITYIDSCERKGIHMVFDVEYADYKTFMNIKKHLEENEIKNYEIKE